MPAVVTGSGGFIGRVLMRRLPGATPLHLGSASWSEAIAATELRDAVVFHLAARVHVRRGEKDAWLADNVAKTEALVQAAARAGAKRFVFVSTLKVHGDETRGRPFAPGDPFDPRDAYSRSKAAAEEHVRDVSVRTGLAATVVRPALVFGPGAKANLRDAVRIADTPWPLPLAGIANRRSWVHVDDLCDLLLRCAHDEAAAGRALIACHAVPFSTPELITGLRAALGRAPRLFRVPARVLEAGSACIGRGEAMRRLTRSLEGDAGAARDALGWEAATPFAAALAQLVHEGPSA